MNIPDLTPGIRKPGYDPADHAPKPTEEEKWQKAFDTLRELCRMYVELSKDELAPILERHNTRRDSLAAANLILLRLGAPTQKRQTGGICQGVPYTKLGNVPTEELRTMVQRFGVEKAAVTYSTSSGTILAELGRRLLASS